MVYRTPGYKVNKFTELLFLIVNPMNRNDCVTCFILDNDTRRRRSPTIKSKTFFDILQKTFFYVCEKGGETMVPQDNTSW